MAVAESLNFRRAAESLHVAQPALSRQIRNLEQDVGARLLHRNTGGVSLTDAGTVFLDEARDVLERAEMAAKLAREAESGRHGRLTVGSLGAVSAAFLPAALAEFRTRYPHVEVNLHEAAAPDQIPALLAGVTQIGFTTDASSVRSPALESTEVLVARLVVAIGRQHRLARQQSISLSDLSGETIYSVGGSERHVFHQKLIESIFAARGIRHRPVKRVNGYESLVALVTGGHGVSLLLPFGPSRRKSELVFRRVKEDGDDLDIHLLAVWKRRGSSQLVRNFVEVLKDRAAPASSAPISGIGG